MNCLGTDINMQRTHIRLSATQVLSDPSRAINSDIQSSAFYGKQLCFEKALYGTTRE